MTWTVFKHNFGFNETTEHAPGRGGFKYVLIPTSREQAVEWWQNRWNQNAERTQMENPNEPRYSGSGEAWTATEYADEEEARKACGEVELEKGGIGATMTRPYTWSELSGRLDVKVVDSEEVNENLSEQSSNAPSGKP